MTEDTSTGSSARGIAHSHLQAAPSASRRLVTCVFCDLAESTALGDRADPEILRELMLGYYEQMQGVVERHGGRLEKFIGDAVAAVWGLSMTREDDAQRAVRAAVEMAKVAENLRPDFEAVAELGFAVRIGVNSGEVMIDPEDLARAAAVLGDAMNTAARLQTPAAHGEVVVGELTRRLAGGTIETDPPLELQLKGKAGVVLGYRVRSVSPLSPDRTAGRTSRMAGRRRELQTLDEALDEVIRTGACRLVLVTGEPGIGKSRLASEFARRSGCTMLRGRCLSYGEGIAYWPLAEVVRAAADIDPSTRPEDARSRIHALVASDPDADRLSAVIGEITGLERAASAASEITWATHRLFRHLAGERLVVCIDDLQWSEEPLRDLVLSLPRALTEVPLLVLCLARPEVIDRDTHWPRHVRVEPLESDAAGVLIQELRPDLPPEVVRNIAVRSGGNPLFAEELVATLARQPTSTDPFEDKAVMPDSLRGLIGARLDMLPPSARAVAACGAVEGEVFHDGAVQAMTPASQQPAVRRQLASLVDAGLIRPEGTRHPHVTYRFRHLLIRDALYSATPKRHRAYLHVRIADWIATAAGERSLGVAAVDALAGYHLERAAIYRSEIMPRGDHAGVMRRASHHLAAAGVYARSIGDVDAAARLLTRARDVLPGDDPRRLELAPRLGEAVVQTGRLDDAIEMLAATRQLAGQDVNAPLALRCELELEAARTLRGDPGAAERTVVAADRAIEELTPLEDHAGLARALQIKASAALHADDMRAMADALERAAEHAERAGDQWQAMESYYWLTLITWLRPQHISRSLDDVGRIANRAGDNRMVAAASMITNGVLHAMAGAPEIGRTECAAGRDTQLSLGQRVAWCGSVLQAGLIEQLAGHYAAAEELYRASIGSGVAPSFEITVALNLGSVLYRQDRLEEAEALCRRGENYPDRTDVVTVCMTTWLRALLLARDGDLEAAHRLARDAVDMTNAEKSADTRIDALFALAEIGLEAGEPSSPDIVRELIRLIDARGYIALRRRADELRTRTG